MKIPVPFGQLLMTMSPPYPLHKPSSTPLLTWNQTRAKSAFLFGVQVKPTYQETISIFPQFLSNNLSPHSSLELNPSTPNTMNQPTLPLMKRTPPLPTAHLGQKRERTTTTMLTRCLLLCSTLFYRDTKYWRSSKKNRRIAAINLTRALALRLSWGSFMFEPYWWAKRRLPS